MPKEWAEQVRKSLLNKSIWNERMWIDWINQYYCFVVFIAYYTRRRTFSDYFLFRRVINQRRRILPRSIVYLFFFFASAFFAISFPYQTTNGRFYTQDCFSPLINCRKRKKTHRWFIAIDSSLIKKNPFVGKRNNACWCFVFLVKKLVDDCERKWSRFAVTLWKRITHSRWIHLGHCIDCLSFEYRLFQWQYFQRKTRTDRRHLLDICTHWYFHQS